VRRPFALLLLVPALALGLAACGSGDDGASASTDGGSSSELTVSAAASLNDAFTAYAKAFTGGTVRLSFAGSDELAAQIRQGVKPDVYAAANTKFPDELYAEKLVEKPVVFAQNTLVLAVPADSEIASLDDLTQPGVTIAMGSETVPVGAYTREVLAGLPEARREAILANVRSNEPDVAGVVGKLTQGAVNAGFVYATDVTATDGKLKAIDLPANLEPQVSYGAAVVVGAENPTAAKAFIDGLLSGPGAEALKGSGFLPPPSG
jgi:molybdate transport system substrate-binding protein